MKHLSFLQRVWEFAAKPGHYKLLSLGLKVRRIFPNLPLLYRLPFGAWYLIGNSNVDRALFSGAFESGEIRFVNKYLRSGMTALDIGAHHGLYTVLASKRVGTAGKVIAFEPSPRERKQLLRNIRLNRCLNVRVEPYALGCERSIAELYVVDSAEDGCNSLRPPVVDASTHRISVEVVTLDQVLSRNGIRTVDFLKLDVEGAELETLQGAIKLLEVRPRPVLLVEVYDIRTQPWGYLAREIVAFLDRIGYRWFLLLESGSIEPVKSNLQKYDANLVAVPEECLETMMQFLPENGHKLASEG
jgi:FkbM family methyltransferase